MRARMLDATTRVRPIPNSWDIAFKRPRGRSLRWIRVDTKSVVDAGRLARAHAAEKHWSGWQEYGASRATVVEVLRTSYGTHGVVQEWGRQ